MQTGKWFAGAALGLSILTLGNTVYTSASDTSNHRISQLEMEHKDDISQLRKKHDGDITAVRVQMDNMETGIHSKLDNILGHMMSIHVDVKVNTNKIEHLEKEKK